MELMRCQLCGGCAEETQDPDGGEFYIECDKCFLKGPSLHNWRINDHPVIPKELIENSDEWIDWRDDYLYYSWNRMQSLIARGLLLEEMDDTIKTTRRL